MKYGFWPTAVLNHKQGLMTNKKLRQAFQAALEMDSIMSAALGNKEFYRLDGALFQKELPAFSSTVGVESYNQRNKDKARRLLKEAGYAGQPVRWLTTQEYEYMYKTALVAKQQLEEIGFKIDLQVLDWATRSPSTSPAKTSKATSGPCPTCTSGTRGLRNERGGVFRPTTPLQWPK